MGDVPRFLPEHLRPQTPGRRSRRGLVLLSFVPFMLLAVPLWRVEHVRVDGCPTLPQPAVASLQALVGQPTVGLDVRAIKEGVEIWPGVGEVQVDFLLPGTINVRAETAPVLGSVRVGRSWHGVGVDGDLTGRLQLPVQPILQRFVTTDDRRRGLEAARRIGDASGARTLEVEQVTPTDYRVRLATDDGGAEAVIHVRPEGTMGEASWCSAFARGEVGQPWADLRWADRMVIGGAE